MRFRFCGDLDAPDWLLAEIATLSKISSVRMKIIVKQVLSYLLEGQIDFEKVLKVTKDTLPENSDVQGAVAGLTFVLSNAAKYDVDDQALLQEIQQLGLPKENSEAVARPFREHKEDLRAVLARSSYQLAKLRSLDWRVDQMVGSSSGRAEDTEAAVQLRLTIDETPNRKEVGAVQRQGKKLRELGVRLTADKFQVLQHELRQAHGYLESIKG